MFSEISFIEPNEYTIQHVVAIKENCYHVDLFRQINNDIYGFAAKDRLYLISMTTFQVMTIIDINTFFSNECVSEIVTGNGCYELMRIGEQWNWGYRESYSFGGESFYVDDKRLLDVYKPFCKIPEIIID